MSRTFTLELPMKAEQFLEYARTKASEKGFRFTGETDKGHFDGYGVSGRYMIKGSTLTMIIDNKPAFIPWSIIETKLDDFTRAGQ